MVVCRGLLAWARVAHLVADFPFYLLDVLLFGFDFFFLRRDLNAQAAVEVQVNVGDEDQGEKPDHVPPPIQEHQVIMAPHEERDRHIVAEAVFAGEEIEELALQ